MEVVLATTFALTCCGMQSEYLLGTVLMASINLDDL